MRRTVQKRVGDELLGVERVRDPSCLDGPVFDRDLEAGQLPPGPGHDLSRQSFEQGSLFRSGPVWTPLIPATMPAEKTKNFGDNTLFDRPAQPAELAPVFVLLASDAAAYITAEVYGVTGGRTPY